MGLLVYPRRPLTLPSGGAVLREPYGRGLVAAFAPGMGRGLTDLVTGLTLTPGASVLGTGGGTAGVRCGAGAGASVLCPTRLKITPSGTSVPAITMIARMAFFGTPAVNSVMFEVSANNTGTSPFSAYTLGIDASGFLRLTWSNGAAFLAYNGGVPRTPVVGHVFTMVGMWTATGASVYVGPDEGLGTLATTVNPTYTATSELRFGGSGTPNVCVEYGLIYNRRLMPSELKLFRDHPYHWLRIGGATQFALGAPPAIEPPPAGWRLTIDGVDQTATVHSLNLTFVLNERAGASIVLGDLLPEKFQEVVSYAKDGVTPLFGGVILTRSFTGRNQYDPDFQCTIECGDYFTYADWTYTGEMIYDTAVTLKAVLTDLVDDYLGAYGVTLHAAQVDGPTIDPFLWRNKRIMDAIRELSDRTGYVATMSPTKVLRMFLPGTDDAPYTMTEAAPHCQELSWADTDQTPATEVIVIAGPNGTREVHDERHYGDGTTRIFPLYAPFVAVIGALSRSDDVGGWPLGICGVDVDPGAGGPEYPYCYEPTDNSVHQRVDQPVLPVGEYIWLWYLAQFPFQVSASCDASPAPAVPIQQVVAKPDVLSIPAAQEIASGLVAASCAQPRELAITTDDDGFLVGQALTVDLPTTRTISGDFVITDVAMTIVLDTDQGDAYWVYTLKAIESTSYQGSYLDQWRRITVGPSQLVAPEDPLTRLTRKPPKPIPANRPAMGPRYLQPGPEKKGGGPKVEQQPAEGTPE